ncbi:dihydrodipicolinate reductase C-terminal domain-containing protein [Kibdelosporangium lantanae]|uniref:4-hydroxy-tetrahydrodipicolinate reductase n=1 Tax=Kibdelosporangium lantanae TaxID=1497396 RepID=A0ABW3MA25_9PSEU
MPDLVVGVVGATGRLGSAVRAECARQGVQVGLAASRTEWRATGRVSVLVDASAPDALPATVKYCEQVGAALIYCVSRVTDESRRQLAELGDRTTVILADNLSVGHWLQVNLVRTVANLVRSFRQQPQMAVRERHPVTKKDSPSASARALADVWAATCPPELRGATTSQRGGPPVSDHEVTFDLPGMSLSIKHSVTDLHMAVIGLLDLVRHVRQLSPGLYPVFDVYSRMYRHGT